MALEHGSGATNPVFDFISICFKSNLTFKCTFATTMNQTNIKTRDNDAHETTQAAKRSRTALCDQQEEQENTDITNDMSVRAINAAVASENHLEEEEQEHDNEHHDNTQVQT